MNKEEQEILARKNPFASYTYCLNNKDVNVRLHEDIIIKGNDVDYIYFFARDIEGANINKLEDAIIKSNKLDYIYYFAKNVKGANINKLEEAIIKAIDICYIYCFAKDVKSANLDKFKNILENSACKEEFAKLYAEWKVNQITEEEKIILANNDPYKCYEFCESNRNSANINAHKDIILNSDDTEVALDFLYNFENFLSKEDILGFKDIVFKTKNLEYISDYIKNFYKSGIFDLKEITSDIIDDLDEATDFYSIIELIKYVPGLDLDQFVDKDIFYQTELYDEFNRIYEIYSLHKDNGISEKERQILINKDLNESYEFCKENSSRVLSYHEDMILNANNVNFAYWFSQSVKGASVQKLQKVINEYGSPIQIRNFICGVKGSDANSAILSLIERSKNYKKDSKDFSRYNLEIISIANNFVNAFSFETFMKVKDFLYENSNEEMYKNIVGKYSKESKAPSNEEIDKAVNKAIEEEIKEKTNEKVLNFFKTNLEEGIYSGIAASAVDNVINMFLNSIKGSITEQSFNAIQTMLSNDLGKSIVYMLIGSGVHFIPSDLKDNKHVAKVAEKCIQNAGSKTTEFGLNFITSILLPSLLNAINSPEIKVANKFRVNSDNTDEDNVLDLVEFMEAKKVI